MCPSMSRTRFRVGVTTLLLAVIPLTSALPSLAANAKKSFVKATVGRSTLLEGASSGRPADTLLDGLDGKVLEDYDDVTLVEVNDSDKDKLKQRGKDQLVLVRLRDDFDKIYLNGKSLDAREDKDEPPPGEKHDPPHQKNEQGA